MKSKMKKLLAFICILALSISSVAISTPTEEVKAAEETTEVTPVYLEGFKHVTLNNFYNNNYSNAEDKMLKDGMYTSVRKYFLTDDGKTPIQSFAQTLLSFKMSNMAASAYSVLRLFGTDTGKGGVSLYKNSSGARLVLENNQNIGEKGDYWGSQGWGANLYAFENLKTINDFNDNNIIVQISIEYGDFTKNGITPDDIPGNDIRLGFYFNGEFFDFNKDGKNTEADRITLFNCDMSKVGNVFSIEKGAKASDSDGIKLESVVPKSETRDIIPVSLDGFQPVTLNNFYNIHYTGTEERPRTLQDGTYTYENAHSNGYQPRYNITDDGKNTSTFDKKLLSVKMQCETTGATTRLRILASGYQSGGVALQKNNDGTKLCFYNIASFGTSGDNMTSDDFYFVPGKEYKINSFNEEFILQISIEYGNFTKDGVEPDTVPNNDIKFGFYINGQLYDVNGDGSYDEKDRLTLLNCNSSLMGNMLTVEPRLSGGSITLSSYVVEDEMSKLTNLEWTDFEGTNQQPAEERAYMSGTGKYTLKQENVSKLGSTSFEANVLFTHGLDRGIYYGGANSNQGINLRPLASGKLAVLFSPINTGLTYVDGSTIGDGGTIILQPDTAGVTSFLNKEFKLSIITRYADYDGDGSADDVELGFFINDKLYDNRYMYLKDYTTYKTVGNCIYFNLSSPILMRSVPEVKEKLHDLTSGTPYTELGNHFSNIGSLYLKDVQITDYSILETSGDYDVKDASEKLIGQVILYKANDTHPDGNVDVIDLVAMLKVQKGTALSTWSGTMGAYAANFSETSIIDSILGIEAVSE